MATTKSDMVTIPRKVLDELLDIAAHGGRPTGGSAVRAFGEREKARAAIVRALGEALGEASISDLERLTGVARRYLRLDLMRLRREGVIVVRGSKRGSVYALAK